MRLGLQSIARWLPLVAASLALTLPLAACGGGGGGGGGGVPAETTGLLEGKVTNSKTGLPVAGYTVVIVPSSTSGQAVAAVASPKTGADGIYEAALAPGDYVIDCPATGLWGAVSTPASVAAQGTTVKDLALTPVANVVVTILGAPTLPAPGALFTLTAQVDVADGSTVTGYQWSQTAEVPATIATPTAAATDVTLGTSGDYKTGLFGVVPELERWRVVAVNPLSAEEAAASTFKLTVTTTSGSYKASKAVTASLPFAAWANGLTNVPLGVPVLLGGKTQATYNWALILKPAGSNASLTDATTRYPWFTPDVAGKYTVTVTEIGASANKVVTIDLYSGPYVGGIIGQDANGRPVTSCATSGCHTMAPYFPEKFTEWAKTGHAEIFTNNLNGGGHYSSSCFVCHTVGYNPDVNNGGFDDAAGYSSFLSTMFPGGSPVADPGNWAKVLATWPEVAQKANIQCENCHGPNGPGSAHILFGVTPDPRISTSADVCGVCHGEPPRHGRFQQWQESAHGDYEVAKAEGTSTSCARCHAAQGFLTWLPRLMAGNNGSLTSADITWAAEDSNPQTCVVCHDPHDVGTVSGDATDAPVRVMGSTPMLPGGFAATNVGKGAMCMVCHNTRNAKHDDSNYAGNIDDRAPHVAAQADVLMGENGYFITPGSRGAHSFIENTCVTCHMELTPPPAEFSYAGSGTNHEFGASIEICSECHGEFKGGENLQATFEAQLESLRVALSSKLLGIVNTMRATDSLKVTYVVVGPTGTETSTTVTFASTDVVNDLQVQAEFHGRMTIKIQVNGTWYENIQMAKALFVTANKDVLHVLSGQTVARAGWNYHLLHGDGSEGIHNPVFAFDLIQNSLDALKAAP